MYIYIVMQCNYYSSYGNVIGIEKRVLVNVSEEKAVDKRLTKRRRRRTGVRRRKN